MNLVSIVFTVEIGISARMQRVLVLMKSVDFKEKRTTRTMSDKM